MFLFSRITDEYKTRKYPSYINFLKRNKNINRNNKKTISKTIFLYVIIIIIRIILYGAQILNLNKKKLSFYSWIWTTLEEVVENLDQKGEGIVRLRNGDNGHKHDIRSGRKLMNMVRTYQNGKKRQPSKILKFVPHERRWRKKFQRSLKDIDDVCSKIRLTNYDLGVFQAGSRRDRKRNLITKNMNIWN